MVADGTNSVAALVGIACKISKRGDACVWRKGGRWKSVPAVDSGFCAAPFVGAFERLLSLPGLSEGVDI